MPGACARAPRTGRSPSHHGGAAATLRLRARPSLALYLLVLGCAQSPAGLDAAAAGTSSGDQTGSSTPSTSGDIVDFDGGQAPGCLSPSAGLCEPGASEPCFEGIPSMRGVGECSDGERTCTVGGDAWGPCLGQLLPRPDDCAAPAAFACDGQPPNCGLLLEAEMLTTPGAHTTVQRLAQNGTSRFVRTSLITHFLAGAPPNELVVEQIVGANATWAASFPLPTGAYAFPELVSSVAVGPDGSIVVAGNVRGDIVLESETVQGPAAIVFKLDPAGQLVWKKVFAETVIVHAVAVGGPPGDIWLAREFEGEYDFGAGTMTAASVDGFLLRLHADGASVWARMLESPTGAGLTSLALGPDGSAYVGGYAVSADPCGQSAALFGAFGAEGVLRWSKRVESQQSSGWTSSLVVDSNGNLFASGRMSTIPGVAMDFGGGPIDGTMFVAKLDRDGGHLWSRGVYDVPHGPAVGGFVALDPGGRLVWANQDEYSVRIRTYHPEGHLLWERLVTVEGTEQVAGGDASGLFGFAMGPDGQFALGGALAGTIAFDAANAATSVTGWDGYFASYRP